jgi:hypothetical protein
LVPFFNVIIYTKFLQGLLPKGISRPADNRYIVLIFFLEKEEHDE